MALDDEFLKQIIETFRAELEEQTQAITDGLLEIEHLSQQGQDSGESMVRVFRAAHNIKGSARGIGVVDVGEIAHHLESLFLAIQKKLVVCTPEVVNLCLEAVDRMREAMQFFIKEKPVDFDLEGLLAELEKRASSGKVADANSETPEAEPAEIKTATEEIIIEEKPQEEEITIVETPLPKVEKTTAALAEKPAETEVIVQETLLKKVKPEEKAPRPESAPAVGGAEMAKSSEYETIRVSLYNLDRVSAYMEEMQINKIAIDDHYEELVKLNSKTKQFSQTWKKNVSDLKSFYDKEIGENIQKLYDSNAERLNDITATINKMHKTMNAHINELTVLSNALQEEVRVLRLIPVSTLLRNLPRTVRDVANNLGKQVTVNIKDNDAKIDKIVLEGIKDPITHLLRNAIDHGLESPEQRKAKGKPEVGHISIDVKEEGNQVVFIISDDGAGIDVEKIADTALKKNIVSKSELESMNDEEIMELIFRSGFSTKENVTDISGRGVGMDVVKSNLTNLRGHVNISTELGKGTTFYLRVPLTLATERGLIVSSSGQLFVITTSSVGRVLLLNKHDIIEVEKSQAILLDNHPVSLCSLADILNFEAKKNAKADKLPVVVIRKGQKLAAVLVDEIIGEREIVIKPLQAPLINVPCVAGATLSGSGEIIIVLNITDLIDKALHSRKNIVINNNKTEQVTNNKPYLLVVDDSPTTRAFSKNVLTNRGYRVAVASDGKEAWERLKNEKFSLVVTDVEMPNMNGFELTERIKKSDSLGKLPVIIVTSLGSEEHRKHGESVGADAYIVKSQFESGELERLVTQLL